MVDRAGVVPQLLGAAVGIVLGSALLFMVVGMLRDDGPPSPEVVAEPSPSAAVEDPAVEDPTEVEEPADDQADESPSPEATPSPAAEASPSEAPSPGPSEEPAAPAEEVDPSTVTIQVLNAVDGEAGSEAAEEVAQQLRDAGFDVVVVNRAGRSYDVTTVFWSPGQAAGGQQVAATIGAGQAEETPDEVQLSDAVDVHVVVGADRA